MSSPIAHGSLMIPAWTYVRRKISPDLSDRRRRCLAMALFVALMGPDLDLLMFPWAGVDLLAYHNHFTHSLLLAPLFSVPFGLLCRWLTGGRFCFFALVGCLCYSSHILLDYMTWGRGVQMFWPLTEQRFAPPFYLFYGVRHSAGLSVSSYLITAANDAAFGFAVWLAARWATAAIKNS